MAFKRKFSSRNLPSKRRRLAVRRRIRRTIRGRSGIHSFTRSYQLTDLTVNSLTQTAGGLSFKLSNLPEYTEFTFLFDQYRIMAAKVEFVPVFTGNDTNPLTSVLYMPNVHSVIDYTESNTPGTLSELMQYSNYKRTRGNSIHKRYLKPAIAASNYETLAASSYTPKWGQWVTTESGDAATPFFGLKYWIDSTNSTTAVTYKVYVKLYFQCKSVK